MVDRPWDPDRKFEGAVLTVYQHWTLEVSWQQHTLGSCILFCHREGVRLMSELTDDELHEMRAIMSAHEARMRNRETFRPDRFDYLQMGWTFKRLHFHIIPRYLGWRRAFDRIWEDPWAYPIWSDERIPRPLMEQICLAFAP